MLRKLVIAGALLALLAGVATVAWQACGMPPLRLVLKYGYPSPMGPTGRTLTIEGVEFVEISPGYFRMGSHFQCDRGDLLGRACAAVRLPWGRQPDHRHECPIHWVHFPRGILVAKTETTNWQFERYSPRGQSDDPSPEAGAPVVDLSWHDATDYCKWLGIRSGFRTRLVSEAEWDCVARAGSEAEFFPDLPFAEDGSPAHTSGCARPVRSAYDVLSPPANQWSLYGISGNASEWCQDSWCRTYADAPDNGSPRTGLRGLPRVVRGPCWREEGKTAEHVRTRVFRPAFRIGVYPKVRADWLGMRPAIDVPD